jgi:hypothetical protein
MQLYRLILLKLHLALRYIIVLNISNCDTRMTFLQQLRLIVYLLSWRFVNKLQPDVNVLSQLKRQCSTHFLHCVEICIRSNLQRVILVLVIQLQETDIVLSSTCYWPTHKSLDSLLTVILLYHRAGVPEPGILHDLRSVYITKETVITTHLLKQLDYVGCITELIIVLVMCHVSHTMIQRDPNLLRSLLR